MRRTTNRLIFLLISFFTGIVVIGQNLTPQELVEIDKNPNFDLITQSLVDKGFTHHNYKAEINYETEARWYFQPFIHSGEEVSSYLIKSLAKDQGTRTRFFLYNPFHYKDFISNLTKSRYKFKGIKIIDNKSYSVFEDKRTTFLTAEGKKDKNRSFFEIIVQAK